MRSPARPRVGPKHPSEPRAKQTPSTKLISPLSSPPPPSCLPSLRFATTTSTQNTSITINMAGIPADDPFLTLGFRHFDNDKADSNGFLHLHSSRAKSNGTRHAEMGNAARSTAKKRGGRACWDGRLPPLAPAEAARHVRGGALPLPSRPGPRLRKRESPPPQPLRPPPHFHGPGPSPSSTPSSVSSQSSRSSSSSSSNNDSAESTCHRQAAKPQAWKSGPTKPLRADPPLMKQRAAAPESRHMVQGPKCDEGRCGGAGCSEIHGLRQSDLPLFPRSCSSHVHWIPAGPLQHHHGHGHCQSRDDNHFTHPIATPFPRVMKHGHCGTPLPPRGEIHETPLDPCHGAHLARQGVGYPIFIPIGGESHHTGTNGDDRNSRKSSSRGTEPHIRAASGSMTDNTSSKGKKKGSKRNRPCFVWPRGSDAGRSHSTPVQSRTRWLDVLSGRGPPVYVALQTTLREGMHKGALGSGADGDDQDNECVSSGR